MSLPFSTVVAGSQQRGRIWWNQIRLQARRPGDLVFRVLTLLFVWIVLALVFGIAWVLLSNAWPTIRAFGVSFLSNEAFDPIHDVYGVRPALFGTFVTSAFALLFALPLGVGTALFLTEFCPRVLRGPLTFLIGALAAIPSEVIGMWGFLAFAPWLQKTGEPWLQRFLGWLPFFQGTPRGLGLLAAGCILTVMILPIISSISREVLATVPVEQREGLLARGAALRDLIERSLKQAALWEEVKDRLHVPARDLSGGQQQRLCIARTIANSPEVILMDEPCSALDPIATQQIEDLIRDLKQRYTVILVTHNMQQAGRTAERTVFFLQGRVVEEGLTDTIFRHPSQKETEDYVSGRFG